MDDQNQIKHPPVTHEVVTTLARTLIDCLGANPHLVLDVNTVKTLQVYLGRTVPNVVNDGLPIQNRVPVTRDDIRDIFLANGFTVKQDQIDLKDYVFAAGEALSVKVVENLFGPRTKVAVKVWFQHAAGSLDRFYYRGKSYQDLVSEVAERFRASPHSKMFVILRKGRGREGKSAIDHLTIKWSEVARSDNAAINITRVQQWVNDLKKVLREVESDTQEDAS